MNLTLQQIFDYQKFESAPALSAVIEAVHGSLDGGKLLSDDDADVWAAGEALPGCGEVPEQRYDKG